ncbi:MAG: hypothetical protein K6B72_10830 [Lachnospiraceae bacterium]|nr:hypothetical protein [Lachnospiraceae bacterium]
MALESREARENSTEELVKRYRIDVMQMARYLPWLAEHAGKQVSDTYQNDNMSHTIPFPVYDSTLLSFIKEFQRTSMIDRNYVYVYSRNRLRSAEDEKRFIEQADIKNMKELAGILSKYVIEGNVRGAVWTEGVTNGVYYAALSKMKEIIEFWGKEARDVR